MSTSPLFHWPVIKRATARLLHSTSLNGSFLYSSIKRNEFDHTKTRAFSTIVANGRVCGIFSGMHARWLNRLQYACSLILPVGVEAWRASHVPARVLDEVGNGRSTHIGRHTSYHDLGKIL